MTGKKILILFIFAHLFSPLVYADIHDTFASANKSYAEGKYQEALAGYLELDKGQVKSGNLYFNIGNAYFKQGKFGKALVNYERARIYIGSEPDLESNIAYCKTFLEQAQPLEQLIWYNKAIEAAISILPSGGWFMLASIFYGILIILILCSAIIPNFKSAMKAPMMLALGGVILFFSSFAINEYTGLAHKRGIVITQSADVRYSPSFDGALAFQVKEGIYVELLRQDRDWALVRLTKKKSGWIPRSAIEII